MIAAMLMAGAVLAGPPASTGPAEVAPGVWLIASEFPPKRQPDGTTVIFRAPQGLVVMDTGRHPARRQAIHDFATARRLPIVAIVNSHWHLDHVSGNPDLKRAYPAAKVYASLAIHDALQGFLPKSAEAGRAYLQSGKAAPETAEDLRADLTTIENGATLRPDVPITRSQTLRLGGLSLELKLAPNAATDGDVWVYDHKSGVAAVGDLVTLPAPFLDTACVAGWKAALDQVWATPFRIAIPGPGGPMSRGQFVTYRAAFGALADCAASSRPKAECASEWMDATRDIDTSDPKLRSAGQTMTEGYVEMLRANGGDSASCKARSARPAAPAPAAPSAT